MKTKNSLILILLLLMLLLPLDFMNDQRKDDFLLLYNDVIHNSIDGIDQTDLDSISLAIDDYESLTPKDKKKYIKEIEYLEDLLEEYKEEMAVFEKPLKKEFHSRGLSKINLAYNQEFLKNELIILKCQKPKTPARASRRLGDNKQ